MALTDAQLRAFRAFDRLIGQLGVRDKSVVANTVPVDPFSLVSFSGWRVPPRFEIRLTDAPTPTIIVF